MFWVNRQAEISQGRVARPDDDCPGTGVAGDGMGSFGFLEDRLVT